MDVTNVVVLCFCETCGIGSVVFGFCGVCELELFVVGFCDECELATCLFCFCETCGAFVFEFCKTCCESWSEHSSGKHSNKSSARQSKRVEIATSSGCCRPRGPPDPLLCTEPAICLTVFCPRYLVQLSGLIQMWLPV